MASKLYVLRKGNDVVVRGLTAAPRVALSTQSYGYGVVIGSDDGRFFTAGAAQKRYLVSITGTRASGYAVTGDSNDALLKMSGNNYAANDANFIWRGVNLAIANRSGGVAGRMEHSIGVQAKSGGTVSTLLGLTITMENYGTCATEAGGMDLIVRNEATTGLALSYGLRIRNDDRSGQAAVQSAIHVASHASSGGFRELIDASGAVLTEYDTGTKVVLMKFQGANATTYYLVHDTDAATAVSVATSVS
jgi:hypothetical protein